VAAVAAGEVDVVVAWHTDRLWRNVVEQQTFLAIGRDAGLKLVATPSNEVDPADADDDFLSTVRAAAAQRESADKSRRMRRRQTEKGERGEWHGEAQLRLRGRRWLPEDRQEGGRRHP
jgi:site-specific DNA recombinase